jgi:hypothetical protein
LAFQRRHTVWTFGVKHVFVGQRTTVMVMPMQQLSFSNTGQKGTVRRGRKKSVCRFTGKKYPQMVGFVGSGPGRRRALFAFGILFGCVLSRPVIDGTTNYWTTDFIVILTGRTRGYKRVRPP